MSDPQGSSIWKGKLQNKKKWKWDDILGQGGMVRYISGENLANMAMSNTHPPTHPHTHTHTHTTFTTAPNLLNVNSCVNTQV